jgi:hypothetical protein
MEAQELLDRYVHAVGQHLPRKQRGDVTAELRTLLAEALEERAEAAGRAPDATLASEVVRAFGQPAAAAARYRQARPLIEAEYYPAFVQVAKVGGVALGGLFAASLAWTLLTGERAPGAMLERAWETFTQFAGYALMNLGLLVLVFLFIQRVDRPQPPEAWNPLALPAVEDPDKIQRIDLLIGTGVLVALITVLNFFPNLIAFGFITDDEWGRWPVLAPEFQRLHLPWLTAVWLAEVGLNLLVLRAGRWRPALRWAEIAINAAGLVVLYRVLADGPILLPAIFSVFIRLGLVVALVIGTIEVVGQVYRAATRGTEPRAWSAVGEPRREA